MSMNKVFGVVVAGLLLMATQSAFAQQPTSTSETYGSWTYRCSQAVSPTVEGADASAPADTAAKMACETTQVLQDAQGNVIAQIAFGLNVEAEDKIVAVFQVPQGTLLSEPVRFGAEGSSDLVEAPYVTCFNSICLARTLVDMATVSRLGSVDKGTLIFVDQSGRNINVLLALDGLKAATERLVAQN